MAIALLQAFWRDKKPVPLRSFTEAAPYPKTSA
jgi:hypothetical protein